MNQSTDCWYCGVPFGGKCHPDVYACVKAVNEELYKKNLQNSEMIEMLRKIHSLATVHDLDPKLAEKIKDISRGVAQYMEKPKSETCRERVPGVNAMCGESLPCKFHTEKRIYEVPAHEHTWGYARGMSTASAMVCVFCGTARQ